MRNVWIYGLTLNSVAGTDLELPLCRHDLGVGAGDLDAGIEAGLVMRLDDVAAEDLAGADTTVIRALGSRVPVHWPAVWAIRHVEQGVLLLEAEPRLLGLVRLHQLRGLVAVVVLVGGSIGIPALAQDEDVGVTAHWVGEDGDGAEVDVGVATGGLTRRRAVKVPFWQVGEVDLSIVGDLEDCLCVMRLAKVSVGVGQNRGKRLTFDFERTPP